MPKLTVDGIEVEFEPGMTVMQVCELAGKEIPRFCYHERLSIAGNCRMCLVEVAPGPPKPAASCALPAAPDMKIRTDSPMVKKAREGVMEFLLINHPLDCPICDQGGECDLQDQAMAYGLDGSRFLENKRAVEDKDLGPLIKTSMTRCIHCTRCVRFGTEVAGVEELGAIGRGEDMEITTYLERAVSSEMSGNVIDLCPVGALTLKPYAFAARPWELRKTESVDVMDAVGSNIRVDARGREVMRILPRLHDDVNEEWISDKTRAVWDGLRRQRLDRPYLRKQGKLEPVTWAEAFAAIVERVQGLGPDKIAGIVGDLAPIEAAFALKGLFARLGSPNLDCRQDGAKLTGAPRAGYLFNSTIAGIESADAILLVGTNPRWEAPIINARIRKRWLAGGLSVGLVGAYAPLTYDFEHLGEGPDTARAILRDGHGFRDILDKAKRPMVIVGQGALARPDGAAILRLLGTLAHDCGLNQPAGDDRAAFNGFNVLHTAAARVGALDVGCLPGEGGRDVAGILAGAAAGEIGLVFLLGADEIDTARLGDAFVVYQGSHGDRGAAAADVILPAAAYTEQDGLFANTEGRVQIAKRAVNPPGEAREDWAILRALSERLGITLPYDSLLQLRTVLFEAHPHLAAIDEVPAPEPVDLGALGADGPIDLAPFAPVIGDFYLTNPIARASLTLAELSRRFAAPRALEKGTGTHG